ncbi:MAG: hypothetical protein JXB10_12580 [Pirellulales bacterium]|nr:hypothetical protein [Pirellulales bacterium]
MRSFPILSMLFLGLILGCNDPGANPPSTPAPPAAKAAPPSELPPPPTSVSVPSEQETPPPPPRQAETPTPPGRSETPAQTPPPPGMIREKADVGSGAKGHYGPGVVTTPAATYWRIRENIAYRINIPHAIQLFEASEGRPLKSEKEFWDRIIKENRIHLPELPPGHRYFFDLKAKELMVEKPQ